MPKEHIDSTSTAGMSPKVAVIGGGLSGLACAKKLNELGVRYFCSIPKLQSSADTKIDTTPTRQALNGFTCEEGAYNFTVKDIIGSLFFTFGWIWMGLCCAPDASNSVRYREKGTWWTLFKP